MKKLMILGGSRYILPVIKKAQEMGIYVITCDYLPGNVAHQYSNEYVNVSIIEKEKVLDEAKKRRISGIISFACDPGVVTAAFVAEKMNLPFQGSFESVSILQDKSRFRDFLKENGFNVPRANGYTSKKEIGIDLDNYTFPVMVKPTDSAGSKGVTKVDSKDAIDKAIDVALAYSIKKAFIIEEYIEPLGNPSDSESFSINGNLVFCSFSSQLFDKNSINPYTPAAFYWPSTISLDNQKLLKEELQRLMRLLDLKTGIYNVECREGKDGKAYIMEVSPRGGGNRLAEMVQHVYGVDLIKYTILAAIGELQDGISVCEFQTNWAEYIMHADKEGEFEDIIIDETIKQYIFEKDIWVQKGTPVKSFSGADKTIGTIIFDLKKDVDIKNNINNLVRVKVGEKL